jgi:hypothetical protein
VQLHGLSSFTQANIRTRKKNPELTFNSREDPAMKRMKECEDKEEAESI